MKVPLLSKQISDLKGMNSYWEEILHRENAHAIARIELPQLLSILNPLEILLICGEYAKNYEKNNSIHSTDLVQ